MRRKVLIVNRIKTYLIHKTYQIDRTIQEIVTICITLRSIFLNYIAHHTSYRISEEVLDLKLLLLRGRK